MTERETKFSHFSHWLYMTVEKCQWVGFANEYHWWWESVWKVSHTKGLAKVYCVKDTL